MLYAIYRNTTRTMIANNGNGIRVHAKLLRSNCSLNYAELTAYGYYYHQSPLFVQLMGIIIIKRGVLVGQSALRARWDSLLTETGQQHRSPPTPMHGIGVLQHYHAPTRLPVSLVTPLRPPSKLTISYKSPSTSKLLASPNTL